MIKIITQKRSANPLFYTTICHNILPDSLNQILLFIDILNSSLLQRLAIQKYDNLEYKVEEFNELIIKYSGASSDDYYIAFYDTLLDKYWKSICEKKYGNQNFVWDEETPMLKFSKPNFEAILDAWNRLSQKEPNYLIITQSDSGWIDLRGVDEISDEEKNNIKAFQEPK